MEEMLRSSIQNPAFINILKKAYRVILTKEESNQPYESISLNSFSAKYTQSDVTWYMF